MNHFNPVTRALPKTWTVGGAVLLSFALLLSLSALGCRTANGFGQDMEKAGEKIQDGTR